MVRPTDMKAVGAAIARVILSDVRAMMADSRIKWSGCWEYSVQADGTTIDLETHRGPGRSRQLDVTVPGARLSCVPIVDYNSDDSDDSDDSLSAARLYLRMEPSMFFANLGGLFRRIINLTDIKICPEWQGRGLFSGLLDEMERFVLIDGPLLMGVESCQAMLVQNIVNDVVFLALEERRTKPMRADWRMPDDDEIVTRVLVVPTRLSDIRDDPSQNRTM